MTKPMPLSDFRAVRNLLEPHEWAIGGEEVAPTDLIKPKVWHGIIDLPDDIAISTSNHNGKKLEYLYDRWGDWIDAIGVPGDEDHLYYPTLDAADCFQACTFDMLHGYYRSALANLRAALELVMIGSYGNCDPTNADFVAWKNGDKELGFGKARDRLYKLQVENPRAWILANDQFPAKAYKDLCKFAHSRPGSGDGDLWRSNGPVFSTDSASLTFRTTLRVYATCYLLALIARPNFTLPSGSESLYELDRLPDKTLMRKALLG